MIGLYTTYSQYLPDMVMIPALPALVLSFFGFRMKYPFRNDSRNSIFTWSRDQVKPAIRLNFGCCVNRLSNVCPVFPILNRELFLEIIRTALIKLICVMVVGLKRLIYLPFNQLLCQSSFIGIRAFSYVFLPFNCLHRTV